MTVPFNRRNFIKTGGSLLLLMPLAQYCNNKSKNSTAKDKPKEKKVARHTSKKKKPPVNMRDVYRIKKEINLLLKSVV